MGHVGVGVGSCRGVVGRDVSCIGVVGHVGVGWGGSCRGGGVGHVEVGWSVSCRGMGCVMQGFGG